jgi:hypothetical protein
MLLSDKFDQYIRAEIDLSMIADLDSVFNEVHRKYPEITSISYIPITKTKADLIKEETKWIISGIDRFLRQTIY